MTQHDYKAAMTEFERIISTHPDYAGVTIHDDHPVALISKSIRIADKLMQEPGEGMIKAGRFIDSPDYTFKAMRDKSWRGWSDENT